MSYNYNYKQNQDLLLKNKKSSWLQSTIFCKENKKPTKLQTNIQNQSNQEKKSSVYEPKKSKGFGTRNSIQALQNQDRNSSGYWDEKGNEVIGSVNLSINYLFSPGIYAIVNKLTNQTYIGQGKFVIVRLIWHFVELSLNIFNLSPYLQTDWNNLNGLENFEFKVLEMGPKWKDTAIRQEIERHYFMTYREQLYNKNYAMVQEKLDIELWRPLSKEAISFKGFARKIQYKHLEFSSVSQAAVHFDIDSWVITSLVDDPLFLDMRDVNARPMNASTSIPIVVDLKHYFLGYAQAGKFFWITISMVEDYLKRKENWSRFDQLTEEQKAQIPDLEAQMQKVAKESTSFARKILIRIIYKNKIYFLRVKNIYEAGKFLKWDITTVQRNCNNENISQIMWEENTKHIKKKVIDLDQLPIYDQGLLYNQIEKITSYTDENGTWNYLIIPSPSAKRYVSQNIAKSSFGKYFPVQKNIVYYDNVDINTIDDREVKLQYLSFPDYCYTEDQSSVTDKEVLAELSEKGFIFDEQISHNDLANQILDSKPEITTLDFVDKESNDNDLEDFNNLKGLD